MPWRLLAEDEIDVKDSCSNTRCNIEELELRFSLYIFIICYGCPDADAITTFFRPYFQIN